MESCEMCVQPGACCVIFSLSKGDEFTGILPKDTAEVEAKKFIEDNDLPFVIRGLEDTEENPENVRVFFGCNHLSKGGFCTIYDKRPGVCRDFEPFKSIGCIMYSGETSQNKETRYLWLKWYREES